MKTFSSILILCFVFTFSNAQDIVVNAEAAPGANFTNYKTFSLVDRDDASTGMDQHKDKTDRAEGDRTGSGYGTQGATGTTDDQGMADTQETTDDQGMADTQETTDDQGMADTQETTDDQNMTGTEDTRDRDQGTLGTTGTTDRDHDQNKAHKAHKDETTADRGTTGDYQKSHAKMGKKKIKEAIKAEMESRGYTYTDSNPDILVNFSVFDGASDYVMGQDQNTYSAWGPQIGQTDQVNIEEGTIVVHMVDAEQNQLVYQAYASGAADEGVIEDDQKVKELISRIFDEIPGTDR